MPWTKTAIRSPPKRKGHPPSRFHTRPRHSLSLFLTLLIHPASRIQYGIPAPSLALNSLVVLKMATKRLHCCTRLRTAPANKGAHYGFYPYQLGKVNLTGW